MRVTPHPVRHPRRGAVVLRLAGPRPAAPSGDVPRHGMPYGAPELQAVARPYLVAATLLA